LLPYGSTAAEEAEVFLEKTLSGQPTDDIIAAYAMTGTDTEFFEASDRPY